MSVNITSKINTVNDVPNTSNEISEIQAMFSGSTVFITGGTGYLGKLLIEKLLRSCSGIKRIYMLARPKKNKSVKERLEDQFNDVVYDSLRKECPDFMSKIIMLEGDTSKPNLGISEENRHILTQEVEFIFHGAATVKFNENLKVATNTNVRGPREMLKLARNCGKLRAYLHISTAYSNCVKTEIDEKLYKAAIEPEKLIYMTDNLDDENLNAITPQLVRNYPNTYPYTKSVAEHIVQSYGQGLPVAIIRPSIIISTASEPIPGWIDNIYGATGVVVGTLAGLLHVLHCNDKAIADVVPADMVVNACIAIAWKTAKDYKGNNEVDLAEQSPVIYNYVSSVQKPLKWKLFMEYVFLYRFTFPTNSAVWFSSLYLTKYELVYRFMAYILHWTPAYIADGLAVAFRKSPKFKNTYRKIETFSTVISYFATHEWKFIDKNVQTLSQELCPTDKKMFDFNLSSLNWIDFFRTYIAGIRLYLFKEAPETLDQAIKRQTRLHMLHITACGILILILCRILYFVLGRFI